MTLAASVRQGWLSLCSQFSALNWGKRLALLPHIEDLLHQPRQPEERLRPFLHRHFGALVACQLAPVPDQYMVEGGGPVVAAHLAEDEREGRVLDADEPLAVLDALQQVVAEGSAGGMAVGEHRVLAHRQVPAADVQHAFLEGHRPGRHAIVEIASLLGPGVLPGAVDLPHGGVVDHLVLVPADELAVQPDGRAHAAVVVEGVAGPVAARVREVEAAGVGHVAHLVAALPGEGLCQPLDGTPVAGAAVDHEDAELVPIRPGGDLGRVRGLVHHAADIPVHAVGVDAEDVLGLGVGNVRLSQYPVGYLDQLLLGQAGRRFPGIGSLQCLGHGDVPPCAWSVESTTPCLVEPHPSGYLAGPSHAVGRVGRVSRRRNPTSYRHVGLRFANPTYPWLDVK